MLANSLVLMGLGIVIIIVGFPSNKKERLRSIKRNLQLKEFGFKEEFLYVIINVRTDTRCLFSYRDSTNYLHFNMGIYRGKYGDDTKH
jgi:hypothetical protein